MTTPVTSQISKDILCPRKRTFEETFWLYVLGIGPLIFIGLLLNAVNLVVLRRQKSSLNPLFLLQVLAVSDILFLVSCLVYFLIRHLYALGTLGDEVFRRRDKEIIPILFYYSVPLYYMAVQHRNWLIVIITSERFLSIVAPLWARVAITRSRVIKIVIINGIIAILMQMVNFFNRNAFPATFPCAPEGELIYLRSQWALDLDQYSYVTMVVIIPLCLMYIMNISLLLSLRRAAKFRAKLTGEDGRMDAAQRQATAMVVAMLIVFTVCETPTTLDRLAKMAGLKFSATHPLLHYGRKIGLLLIVVDSTVNFFAYCASNRRFRETLKDILHGRRSSTTSGGTEATKSSSLS